jgi:hypothetical protein
MIRYFCKYSLFSLNLQAKTKKNNEIDLTFNISANGEDLIAFLKQNQDKHSSHTREIKQRCE